MSGSATIYLAPLVIPYAALESRRELRSASKGDSAVKTQEGKFTVGNKMFEVAGPLNGTLCQIQFEDLR